MALADDALTSLDADNTTFKGMAHMCREHAALLLGQGARSKVAFATAERLGRAGEAHNAQ